MNGIIYKWTCNKSGKSYIGQTVNESRREKEFLSKSEIYTISGSKIDNARKKYGVDNTTWKKDVLKRLWCKDGKENELLERLNYWEKYYIEKYDTFNNGYNSTDGGSNGFLVSDETREKLRKNGLLWWNNLSNDEKERHRINSIERWNNLSSEEKNIFKENGKKWWNSLSDEDKENYINDCKNRYKTLLEKTNIEERRKFKYWLGKLRDASTNEKNRQKHIGKKKNVTTKEKIRKSVLSHNFGKPIKQFDLNGNLIREYSSISEAVRLNGFSDTGISKCARGLQKNSKGYIWKFSNEEDKIANVCKNKGYYFYKRLGKYKARLRTNGKEYNLGFYRTENAASAIYKIALENKNNIDDWFKGIEKIKQDIIKRYDFNK